MTFIVCQYIIIVIQEVSHLIINSILRVALFTGVVLMIPLVAMQFNTGVDWDETDFIITGVLLTITGTAFEIAMSKLKSLKSRVIAGGLIFLTLFLIWAELAVGIFGTPFAGS